MITYEEMQARLFQAENTIKELKEFIVKLRDALQWYVNTDTVEKLLAELRQLGYIPEPKD